MSPQPVVDKGVAALFPHSQAGAELRARCLWLGRRAAYDRGLVGRLAKAHGSFAAALAQPRAALAHSMRPCPASEGPGTQGADDPAVATDAAGRHEAVIAWCDAEYPPGLRELFDPPPVLYLRGLRPAVALRALRLRPTVAIVGSRRPSPYGLEMAWLLGGGLARAGVNVVSGMALGIDAQSHVGALEYLEPDTVTVGDTADPSGDGDPGVALAGVLGAGVRIVAPRTNAALFVALERRGLLLSEYGWLLPPQPWRFPARNRVIAALADAVVIVEGDARSGALHTAAFAADLGRDVMAVPGEAGRPLSAGPHRLLREGAHLCESPDDVLSLLPDGAWRRRAGRPDPGFAAEPGPDGRHGGLEGRLLAVLRRGRHTADQLQQTLGVDPQTAAAALSALEIDGLLDVQPGGLYRARRGAANR